jgi:hypothetical protein
MGALRGSAEDSAEDPASPKMALFDVAEACLVGSEASLVGCGSACAALSAALWRAAVTQPIEATLLTLLAWLLALLAWLLARTFATLAKRVCAAARPGNRGRLARDAVDSAIDAAIAELPTRGRGRPSNNSAEERKNMLVGLLKAKLKAMVGLRRRWPAKTELAAALKAKGLAPAEAVAAAVHEDE